ncbi:putative lipase domain protein [Trypanosoma theileri]|uniref:sn-1-specific diacylglycerol lipase n=1 Tax=Trypanosoma theileri TaxID=67003 RepID=A0A1X0P6P4_9TRYP|nr:putative lipase domain protein [Trypanosoma theileri]ORC92606.1 putative lipase domain protein [Trypanosoma theileri]
MPALYWCGRKWRTSSDDFTFSGIFFFALLLASGVCTLTRFGRGDVVKMWDCPDASGTFSGVYFSLGIVDIIGAVAFLITGALSCLGTPFQVSKRRHVPLFLYLTTFIALVGFVLCVIAAKYSMYDDEFRFCKNSTKHLLHAVIAFNFLVPIVYFFMMALVFDPDGRDQWDNLEDYEILWGQRCRLLCCSCFKSSREDDAFRDVAKTLAGLFRGYDLVPSDVVAGLLLVSGMQLRSLRLRRGNIRYPPAGDGCSERISLQAQRFPLLTEEQRQQLAELHTYSRFYMSVYGWPLYEYMHCCIGVPKLCCYDPFMCCRRHPGMHTGTVLFCDLTALLKVSGLPDEDIILTSWENRLFRPVFFVALDRSTNSVIVSIRGTMSFADCVTDLVATPSLLEVSESEREAHTTPDDYYVHGGMKQSAAYVLNELQETGILQDILTGQYKNQKLVILGHSLGAGVATILSILLHTTQPRLRDRIRCLAYAPPGGLLSPALVSYSKSFVLGCFVGNDVIPRMAAHTFDNLRESIFDALANSSLPKSLLFINILRIEKIVNGTSPSANGGSLESCTFRNALRNYTHTSLTDSKKLFPPATLIHFCKAVVRGCCSRCLTLNRFFCVCKCKEVFVPKFETPSDVQVVVCAPSMLKDHFPDRLFSVIEETHKQLESGELERFFSTQEDEIAYLGSARSFSHDDVTCLV